MNVQDVLALLYMEKRLFPREKSLAVSADELKEIAKTQAEMLKDIPFDLGKAAVAAHAANSPYAPAISEIRAYAKKMTEPPAMTADEAYALALGAIRRYGCAPYMGYPERKYPMQMARESVPPEVWDVMNLVGYHYMCMSERPETVRAQFIAAWERQQKAKSERASFLPFLPERLKKQLLASAKPSGEIDPKFLQQLQAQAGLGDAPQ